MRLSWAVLDGQDCLRLSGSAGTTFDRLRKTDAAGLAEWMRVSPTDVAGPGSASFPAMAGRHVVADDGVAFVPRFPFVAGTSYTVMVTEAGCAPTVLTIERPAAVGTPTTEVTEIYPTAAEVPFNLLRASVRFSAPMSEGDARHQVRVVDDRTGDELVGALLPMETELWNRGRTRLTVLFDPARIKRGLAPHLEAGYPLQPGRAVRVVIGAGFRDAAGQPVVASHSRRYDVGLDVRERVDPAAWRVAAPRAGAADPLVVDLDRPLDHALLQRCLSVTAVAGGPVAGTAEVAAGERRWRFVPSAPWAAGEHHLVIDTALEDLAGNSVARVFDRELARADHIPITSGVVTIPFAL